MTIPGHLSENNRIETRRWLTPYEVKNLPPEKVIMFLKACKASRNSIATTKIPTC
jgi:hypothetical protein